MKLFHQCLLYLVIPAIVITSPIEKHSSYSIKETHSVPPRWTPIGEPDPQHILSLHIGLKQDKFDELEQHLFQVSEPSHPRYGQHLSKSQVDDLVTPSPETTLLVHEWLFEHGIASHSLRYNSAHDWLRLDLPINKVEELLDTKYLVYRHEDGSTLIRTTQWSLPLELHDHITTIQPTTAFLRSSPQLRNVITIPGDADIPVATSDNANATSIEAACDFTAVSTYCLSTLYGTVNYTAQSNGSSQIGFTNYLNETTNRTDVERFLFVFREEALNSTLTYTEVSIDDGPISGVGVKGTAEASLDVETILGLVWPLPVTLWSTGGSPPFTPDILTRFNTNEPYLSWLNYVTSQDNLPQVISTSYGDDEQTVPYTYAKAVCDQLAQLGARGISLIFATGDNGVGVNGTCVSNVDNTPMFIPSFPASCPYITAVGGTMNYPEVVANDSTTGFVSGSGFSNYFARPDYQTGVVENYLTSLNGEFSNLFNSSGRAYPDVATLSVNYSVVAGGRLIHVDGTSAATPTFASIITLVNDALIAAGQPVLGWLNPWLYKTGYQAFTDVVNGSSSGCGTSGFPAGPGWDVASGFGTPDFGMILNVLGI